MLVYIYKAELYCEDCGKAFRQQITGHGLAPKNLSNESTYDSDNFPKGPYPDGGGEADSPQHCGAGPNCLNALKLSDGRRIGTWLWNELTAEGIEFVNRVIQEGGEVAELWAGYYRGYSLETRTECP